MKLGTKVPYTNTQPEKCIACNGSGWYDALDDQGNPIPCGSCDGTGEK